MTNNMGTIIKKRREQLGISQEQLANILGYKSRSSINKIELNHTDLPQSKIVALAKALSVTPAYLMGWEDIEQPIPKSNFGLKIKGDSMEPKIHDNDIVIVKSMSDAENNDIVIAMINNEATCKRLHKYSNSVVLTAINSDYKPIEVTPDENIQILGKVVMSISKF